jgi:hypothetical protein
MAPRIATDRVVTSPCGSFGTGIAIEPFCGNLNGTGEIVLARVQSPDLFPFTATNYRVSITVIHHDDGSVSGEYQLNGQGARIHAAITCVGTHPNQTGPFTIGGVVDQSTNQALVGRDIGLNAATPDFLSLPIAFFDHGPVSVFGYTFPDIAHAFCAGMPVTSATDFPDIQSEDVSVRTH